MSTATITIQSVNVGKPQLLTFDGKELATGIYKEPLDTTLHLSKVQLTGDGQADLEHHGGEDKAVCVYSYEHYAYWEERLGQPLRCGAFGENLTVSGMLEDEIHIGDIFQWGEAELQVSQPRQPCYKLAKRYGKNELPFWVQETGYTGFYFRVLKEGAVGKDQPLQLLKKHPAQITLSFANRIMHQEKDNHEGIKRILALDELSTSWRRTFTKRLGGSLEDTSKRVNG